MDDLIQGQPAPALTPYVQSLWMRAGHPPGLDRAAVMFPTGLVRLSVAVDGQTLRYVPLQADSRAGGCESTAVLAPVCTAPYGVFNDSGSPVVGAVFRPGGLQAFLNDRVADLGSGPVSAREAWGEDVLAWPAQLAAAGPDAASVFRVLDALLLGQLRSVPGAVLPMQTAARVLTLGPLEGSIARAAASVGRTHRQFTQSFRAGMGVTPKVYQRLARLRLALRLMHPGDARLGAQVAMECDYFDQAHFAREFRALVGMTPSAYRELRRDEEHSACVFTRTAALWRWFGRRPPPAAIEADAGRLTARSAPPAAAPAAATST
jgi:AraC-like DNA-binding protein